MVNTHFNAMVLAQKGFNPQLSHLGMIEFHIDGLVPGGKEVLALGLSEFAFPTPRASRPEKVDYLNGAIKYPGKVEPIGDFTCSFVDYIDGNQRKVLHQWFDYVYNERSGVGGLPSKIKVNAHAVLYGPDGVTRASYLMIGVWPLGDPPLPGINFSSGTLVKMSMSFSADFIDEEFVNRIDGDNGGGVSGFGTIGAFKAGQAKMNNLPG
jgi:hypothetical protein